MKFSEFSDKLSIGPHFQRQLKEAHLTELASVLQYPDEGPIEIYAATDQGLYVGKYEAKGLGTLEGIVTPWSEVFGSQAVFVGFGGKPSTVVYTIKFPNVHLTGHDDSSVGFKSIVEIWEVVNRNARGWMARQAESEAGS